jgi:hypothetical protein
VSDRQTFVQCLVPYCERSAHWAAKGRNGYCSNHNYRWKRHGDPLGGRIPPGEAPRFLYEVAMRFSLKQCLIWPYAQNGVGYGKIVIDGRHLLVHRLVCERVYGPPPTDKHFAAHSCGRGHEGCCSPAHVRWATPTENSADQLRHGTRRRGEACGSSKLDEAAVIDIRRRAAAGEGAREIAAAHSVTPSNVHYIVRRNTWAHIP